MRNGGHLAVATMIGKEEFSALALVGRDVRVASGVDVHLEPRSTGRHIHVVSAPRVASCAVTTILSERESCYGTVARPVSATPARAERPACVVWDDCPVAVDSVETACPGCRVQLPTVDAPTHPYMTCSPACWVRFGDLLAAQYADPHRMAFHQLVVDAYAVQHPDGNDPRAIQSVGIHVMTLCLFLERGTDPALGTRLHQRMVDRPVFHQLEPPASRGRFTMLNVPLEGEPHVARAASYAWADATWAAWMSHHQTVREWVDNSSLGAQS